MKRIRIGTRGSKLALIQAELSAAWFKAIVPGVEIEIVPIVTSGDKKQGTVAAGVSEKRDWIDEIERAVVEGEVDFAIHSAKDVPVEIDGRTVLFPVMKRADARDVFIARDTLRKGVGSGFLSLPKAAVVGTCSVRRQAQLAALRPDITLVNVRGNVTTRIEKLKSRAELDGLVLAAAGVGRLGLPSNIGEPFQVEAMVPSMNQGFIGCQCSLERNDLVSLIQANVEPRELAAFNAERAVIATLNADCQSAVGVYAIVDRGELTVHARVNSPDGKQVLDERASGEPRKADQLGSDIARRLLKSGANDLLLAPSLLRGAPTL